MRLSEQRDLESERMLFSVLSIRRPWKTDDRSAKENAPDIRSLNDKWFIITDATTTMFSMHAYILKWRATNVSLASSLWLSAVGVHIAALCYME
ncbi:hypothetical protein QQ045_000080 [Rhodiola kirilowii]